MQKTAWAFPPVPLCARVIAKCRQEKGSMILILPMWCARPHFPLLFDKKGHSVEEVTGFYLMRRGDILMGKQGRPWFLDPSKMEKGRFPFVAIRFEGGLQTRICKPFCLGIYFRGRCKDCRPERQMEDY